MSEPSPGLPEAAGPRVDWLTIVECPCENGRIESDWDAGVFYPCSTCNPDWSRLPFGALESSEIANHKANRRRMRLNPNTRFF